MKNQFARSLFTSLLFATLTLLPFAASAQQMNYQGRLTDANGDPLVDGQYTLTFNIYDAATAGNVVWGPIIFDGSGTPGHAAKADLVDGRFNVILGPIDTASRALTDAFAGSAGATRFLGIQVAANPEILPRQQILAAPQALHADIADSVIDGAIGTAQLADGSVTPEKFAVGSANWLTDGSTVFNLNNVAIGTNTAEARLHVEGGLKVVGGIEVEGIHTLQFDNRSAITARNTAGTVEEVMIPRWVDDRTYLTYGSAGMNIRNIDSPASTVIALDAAGNATFGGAMTAPSINGELEPYSFEIGNAADSSLWHSVQIPSSIIQNYLGDADGGTIRMLLRVNSTDQVAIIEQMVYIEQPNLARGGGVSPGLNGQALQSDFTAVGFILGNGVRYDVTPSPYSWIYVRNYETRGLPGLPGGAAGAPWTGANLYRLEFLTAPNVSATVIIYDR